MARMMAQSDSSSVAGNSVKNSLRTGRLVAIEVPKIAVQHVTEIVEVLHIERPVEAELVRGFRAWRSGDMTRSPESSSDGIAGQEADEREGDDGNADEGRDQDARRPMKKPRA